MTDKNLLNSILPDCTTKRSTWGQLHGSSIALAISSAIEQNNGVIIVITPNSLVAQRLEKELSFFCSNKELTTILHFPDWETLPYDNFSPHQDIISARLSCLQQLQILNKGVIILPISTLMTRLPPCEYITAHSLVLEQNQQIDLQQFRRRLEHCGYRCVTQVMEHGEFAIRGSLFDIFPMGTLTPYRIDLFDDEIDSIRIFDPETQRSQDQINKIDLLPAREFPLTEQGITLFRKQWREQFTTKPTDCPIYQAISDGACPAGIEYYLPLFFAQTTHLFDYLNDSSLIMTYGDLEQAADQYWQEINERYEQRRHDLTRPLLSPQQLFLQTNQVFQFAKKFSQIKLLDQAVKPEKSAINFAIQPAEQLLIDHKHQQPLHELTNFITTKEGRILLTAESAGRREALLDLLNKHRLQPKTYTSWTDFLQSDDPIGLCIANLDIGFSLIENKIHIIAEAQLFGQQAISQRRRKGKYQDNEAVIRDLAELSIGSPVVHIDHGVGRYLGLQTLSVADRTTEFLHLEYAGGDKLYVPVASLHLINRYSGSDLEHAPLHRLGTDKWSKAKRKAAEQVRDVAAELLDVYARRAARIGHAFTAPNSNYQQFSSAFPFEETEDQANAINDVVSDMVATKPMDRLVCGDVGFGKTEVAIRAAFLAVENNKQVAILVPTTLLAQQHYETFCDRFADWPVNIELISRFRSASEQKNIIQELDSGKVDIIIGTHALIQSKIKFNNLGLVIIDEEHRFGVRQKERLKSLRAEVDILTLTATPIPRTLNMAVSGLRELSIIATPPARRLAIKTFVHEHNKTLVREAILREVLRGGQVYYLHNKVETIERTAEAIKELVPEANIAIAHGQLRERDLEKVMVDFYHQRFSVLVCTTIIETGIDVPTANTIIIDRADRFGLAQLHQLRGRVGRSHHQAYAYLMTPDKKLMTKDAAKRLDAIGALEELGIGFTLATHDLEIRGAGELLGDEQSGNMQAIGFSLYMELLEEAVKALKSGKQPELEKPLHHGTEIDLQLTALIPDDYIPDVHTRLMLYKRIANAKIKAELTELQVEMIDRFGLLPQQVKNLFESTELKLLAMPLGIKKIDANNQNIRIEFQGEANVDPLTIINLIQQQPQIYQLDGADKLRVLLSSNTTAERFNLVNKVLNQLKS